LTVFDVLWGGNGWEPDFPGWRAGKSREIFRHLIGKKGCVFDAALAGGFLGFSRGYTAFSSARKLNHRHFIKKGG